MASLPRHSHSSSTLTCRICEYRLADLSAPTTSSTLGYHYDNPSSISNPTLTIPITLIILRFKYPIPSSPNILSALGKTLTRIKALGREKDKSREESWYPDEVMSWGPVIGDPKAVLILTSTRTADEVDEDWSSDNTNADGDDSGTINGEREKKWSINQNGPRSKESSNLSILSPSSPIFDDTNLRLYLAGPPEITYITLDYAAVGLGASSPESRILIELIFLRADSKKAASAIGKRFGWEPKRNTICAEIGGRGVKDGEGSKPGDLIWDFWAWETYEIADESGVDGAGSKTSDPPVVLSARNSDSNVSTQNLDDLARSVGLDVPGRTSEGLQTSDGSGTRTPPEDASRESETLILLFHWQSFPSASRFKNPREKSYGPNAIKLDKDLYERKVAGPIREAESEGVRTEIFRVELRGVGGPLNLSSEPEDEGDRPKQNGNGRSRRFSEKMGRAAAGLGEKVTGFLRGGERER